MNNKKVDLFFGDMLAGFEIELQNNDLFGVNLTEYKKNEKASSESHEVIEVRTNTEVFVTKDEINSIIRTLQFITKEDDAS